MQEPPGFENGGQIRASHLLSGLSGGHFETDVLFPHVDDSRIEFPDLPSVALDSVKYQGSGGRNTNAYVRRMAVLQALCAPRPAACNPRWLQTVSAVVRDRCRTIRYDAV